MKDDGTISGREGYQVWTDDEYIFVQMDCTVVSFTMEEYLKFVQVIKDSEMDVEIRKMWNGN